MTKSEAAGVNGRGRRILLALGVVVIALGGLLGFVVGANTDDPDAAITVLGLFAVPLTPGAMAVYGMIVITVAIGVLYGLISIASRYDSNAA